ncbi:MAG: hypothetical protein GY757_26145, partial [bacterium]|nr:hypothetical protein [bacterium]
IDDDFFAHGGDSIKAIQIISRLKKYKLTTDVTELFLHKTIRQLAKHLKTAGKSRKIPQGLIMGDVSLTPVQQWFIKNHLPGMEHFNQSVMLFSKTGFNETFLEKTFTKIVTHHDALRMVYEFDNQTIRQKNRGIEGKLFELSTYGTGEFAGLSKEETVHRITQHADRIQRSFDLQKGPMLKLGLFKTPMGDYLLIVIHHFVIDAVSWRILLEELRIGYTLAAQKKAIVFQEKTDSFKQWAHVLETYAGSKQMLMELPYWKTIEKTKVKKLPVDNKIRAYKREFKYMDAITIELTKEDTEVLLKKVNPAYNTEINDILLTALGLAVKQWAGMDRVPVHLEGHGREKIVENIEIERTLGWFTTIYPVVLEFSQTGDIGSAIKHVKETLMRVPAKGIGYGILKYLTSPEHTGGLEFRLKPEIAFNYLGRFGGENRGSGIFELAGLPQSASGDEISPEFQSEYKLHIEGVDAGGIMKLSFIYSKHEYEKESIGNLAGLMKENLLKIISHCTAAEQGEVTPSDLGYNKISIAELDGIYRAVERNTGIDGKSALRHIYPLTPLQKDVFFFSLGDRRLCFVQNEITLKGALDKELLAESIAFLFKHDDTASGIFIHEHLEEPLRIVLEGREPKMRFEDITHLEREKQDGFLETFIRDDGERGFDIAGDIPVRITLIKTGKSTWKLLWNFHHILMNAFCFGMMFERLVQIYRDLKEGKTPHIEVVPYRNYIRWQERQDREEALAYWQGYLEGYEPRAIISAYRETQIGKDKYRSASYVFSLDETVTDQLVKRAAEACVTFTTLFKAAWGRVLQQLTGSDDVVFGMVVSGRPPEIEGIQEIIGLLVNIIPVRTKPAEPGSLFQYLEELQQQEVLSKNFEYLSLSEIEALKPPEKRWVDSLLAIENDDIEDHFQSLYTGKDTGFEIKNLENNEETNFDFTVGIVPGKRIRVIFLYNTAAYKEALVTEVAGLFEKVLKEIAD